MIGEEHKKHGKGYIFIISKHDFYPQNKIKLTVNGLFGRKLMVKKLL